jgi:hypothetical protein
VILLGHGKCMMNKHNLLFIFEEKSFRGKVGMCVVCICGSILTILPSVKYLKILLDAEHIFFDTE